SFLDPSGTSGWCAERRRSRRSPSAAHSGTWGRPKPSSPSQASEAGPQPWSGSREANIGSLRRRRSTRPLSSRRPPARASAPPASVTAVTEVRLTVGDSAFLAIGRKILNPGWREILPEPETITELPSLSEGEAVPIQEIRVVEDRTKSPPLHSQGSLLLAMQRLELGTKSTRHEILDLLFRRQFVTGRSMRTTAAGRALVDALTIYGPDIASPEMTRHL